MTSGVFSEAPGYGTLYIKGEFDRMSRSDTDYYKVGIVRGEKDARDRDKALKTGNPRSITTVLDLRSPFVQRLETRLHNEFAAARVASTEWFHTSLCPVEKMATQAKHLHSQIISSFDSLAYYDKMEPSNSPTVPPDREIEPTVEELSLLAADRIIVNRSMRAIKVALDLLADEAPEIRQTYYKPSKQSATASLSAAEVKKRYPHLYQKYFRSKPKTPKPKFSITPADSDPAHRCQELGVLQPEVVNSANLSAADLHHAFLACWSAEKILDWQQWFLEARLCFHGRYVAGIDGVWHWDTGLRNSFDKAGFQADHPELAQECTTFRAEQTTWAVAEWLPGLPSGI